MLAELSQKRTWMTDREREELLNDFYENLDD